MGLWNDKISFDVGRHRKLENDLREKRKGYFSPGLRRLPVHRLVKEGVDRNEIALIAQCPIEEIDELIKFDREGRKDLLVSMRRIVQEHQTFDYYDKDITLEEE